MEGNGARRIAYVASATRTDQRIPDKNTRNPE